MDDRPFASTGPHGHRSRMRDKLLTLGPAGFAEYELLEMLLFLGIERRDTKPLAKATINRFGSLASTISAPAAGLQTLGPNSIVALKLVEEAAGRLARAEVQERAHLGNWERLTEYLDANTARSQPWRALFLNNRNRLLADEALAADGSAAQSRTVAARALDLHATAVILVCESADRAGIAPEVLALARQVQQAASLLSVQLHDAVTGGPGRWTGLRSAGHLR